MCSVSGLLGSVLHTAEDFSVAVFEEVFKHAIVSIAVNSSQGPGQKGFHP